MHWAGEGLGRTGGRWLRTTAWLNRNRSWCLGWCLLVQVLARIGVEFLLAVNMTEVISLTFVHKRSSGGLGVYRHAANRIFV
jgi:hypothetical protein